MPIGIVGINPRKKMRIYFQFLVSNDHRKKVLCLTLKSPLKAYRLIKERNKLLVDAWKIDP